MQGNHFSYQQLVRHAMDSASANVIMDDMVYQDHLASRRALEFAKNMGKTAVTNQKTLVEATRG